jgi:ParB family chromosome partitioning protein
MKSTRSLLEKAGSHLSESIGLRESDSRPNLSPIASPKDIGRRGNRNFGRIDIDRIAPDPDQPRVEFDEEALEQLANSIREKGQLSPIRVRWSDEKSQWLIISGERRWRASRRAGLKMLDCYFQEQAMSPTEILEEQLIENLLRSDLRPIEEAESYRRLMEVNQWNGKQIARALSISPTRVSRALSLLRLPSELQSKIESGEVSARAGYELSKLPATQVGNVDVHSLTVTKAATAVKQRRGKSTTITRGVSQTFYGENGWRVIVKANRKGTYDEMEQALQIALEEVQTRIRSRVKLL